MAASEKKSLPQGMAIGQSALNFNTVFQMYGVVQVTAKPQGCVVQYTEYFYQIEDATAWFQSCCVAARVDPTAKLFVQCEQGRMPTPSRKETGCVLHLYVC
jgi:hypothetical protein